MTDLRLWMNQRGTLLHVTTCSMTPPFPLRRLDYEDVSLREAVSRALAFYDDLRPHRCIKKGDDDA
jgi:hypothetical protein